MTVCVLWFDFSPGNNGGTSDQAPPPVRALVQVATLL